LTPSDGSQKKEIFLWPTIWGLRVSKSKRLKLWPKRDGRLQSKYLNTLTLHGLEDAMGERLTRQPRSPAQMEKGMSLNITTPVVHAGAWDAFLIDDTLLDVFFCNNDKPNFFFGVFGHVVTQQLTLT
jgi:hypothetical protein